MTPEGIDVCKQHKMSISEGFVTMFGKWEMVGDKVYVGYD